MKKQRYNIGEPLQNIGLVSVVVPVYNSEKFLTMSLQSLINQTYPYWQAILVNDGSSDDSLELLYRFAEKDKRFSVINKENGGVSSARNAGLEKANIAKIFKCQVLENKKFDLGFRLMAEDFNFSLDVFQYIGKMAYVRNHLLAYRQKSNSLTHKPLSEQAIDDHIRLLRFAVWRFKDALNRRMRVKLWTRLSKLVLKYCCILPYFEDDNYLKYWEKYSDKCRHLVCEKTFFPTKLPFFYRFLCWLFLHKKWKLLAIILSFYQKLKKWFIYISFKA